MKKRLSALSVGLAMASSFLATPALAYNAASFSTPTLGVHPYEYRTWAYRIHRNSNDRKLTDRFYYESPLRSRTQMLHYVNRQNYWQADGFAAYVDELDRFYNRYQPVRIRGN